MTFCDRCGKELQEHEIYLFDGKELCEDCLNSHTAVCIHCDERIWEEHNAGTISIPLCQHCYDAHYTSCEHCGTLLSYDDACYLGRNMGKIWLLRDIDRVRAIVRLCELGYSKQIVLSQDLCFQICYKKYGGGGYAHILENILPIMRDEGIYMKCIDRMLIENPRRILSIEG